jgi:hypothetical protein
MKLSKYLALFLFIGMVARADAQKGILKLNLQYSYAIPLGDFKTQVISESSPRGATADLLFGVSNKVSVGLGFGFQDFYQKYPRDLYKTGNTEVTSAVLSNSVQVMPVLLKAEVHPMGGTRSPVQPYLSVGAGLGIAMFTQYLGEFGFDDYTGKLMLQGGAGFAIPFNRQGSAGFRAGANYNLVNYNKNGFGNFNNINFQGGLFFPLH